MSDQKTVQTVRTAVIGYGFAGRSFHSYLISLAPGLTLQGIASRDPQTRDRIIAERGCRAYKTFDEVIADPTIDLVVLATPNHTHAELAVQALDAGKHVVSDKVMCLTISDCDRMMEAAKRNSRFLSVFQNRRWDGDFLTVQKLIADGDLGNVRWVEMAWQGFGAWGGWRGQSALGGGRFYDLGAHLVDQAVMLFPQAIETVYCRMHHDFPNADVESEALIIITFAGGATVVCDLSSLTAISKPRFSVHGDQATYEKYGLDPQEAAMKAGDIDAAVEPPASSGRLRSRAGVEHIVKTLPGRWRNYYENIADVLLHGADPLVKLPEVCRAISVLHAARQSAETGTTIRFAPEP
ncbi:MAG: Gfo/Idh/MocA family oxidoreductase [Armatimonadota bacterium]